MEDSQGGWLGADAGIKRGVGADAGFTSEVGRGWMQDSQGGWVGADAGFTGGGGRIQDSQGGVGGFAEAVEWSIMQYLNALMHSGV